MFCRACKKDYAKNPKSTKNFQKKQVSSFSAINFFHDKLLYDTNIDFLTNMLELYSLKLVKLSPFVRFCKCFISSKSFFFTKLPLDVYCSVLMILSKHFCQKAQKRPPSIRKWIAIFFKGKFLMIFFPWHVKCSSENSLGILRQPS